MKWRIGNSASAGSSDRKTGKMGLFSGARRESPVLALVPLTVASLLFLLLVPRGTPPDDVPLPPVDRRELDAVAAADAALAGKAAKGLDADVRAVGSALAALHVQLDVDAPNIREVDLAVDGIADEIKRIQDAKGADAGLEAMLTLRALQLQEFLGEVRVLRQTGVVSEPLRRLAAPLVRKLTSFGWFAPAATDHRYVIPEDRELAVLFKRMWNTETGLAPLLSPGHRPDAANALTAQYAETRAERLLLHRLNLRTPHAESASMVRLALAKRIAATPAEKLKAEEDLQVSSERFRAAKIADVRADDPSYPVDYALGVALYRAHDYEHSAEALLRYTELNPGGDYALRARHHLAAVLRARDR
jgi:hypothetical protein